MTSPEFIHWKGLEAAIWKEEPFYIIFRKIRGTITTPIRLGGKQADSDGDTETATIDIACRSVSDFANDSANLGINNSRPQISLPQILNFLWVHLSKQVFGPLTRVPRQVMQCQRLAKMRPLALSFHS